MTTVRGPAAAPGPVHRAASTWEAAWALPHPRLRPGVISYHGFRYDLDRPRRRLETPIGAVTLMLGFEQPVRISSAGRPAVSLVSVYSGLGTTPAVGEHEGRLSGVSVLLTPWAAFSLFGIAQHELSNRYVDPDDLGRPPGLVGWGSIAELVAALAGLSTWSARFALLDDVLTRCVDAGTPCSPRIVGAWNELVRTGGTIPVSRLAHEVGWSVRQLENRFREQIGLGPKAAARVLRLQRARRLLVAGHTQAETAAACGFYDQAHLSGEFRAMTGCTPAEFTAARSRRAAQRSGPPATDRLTGEATSLVLPPGRSAPFSKTDRHH
ncbi:AraC family transcriptional regulator [Streptomyces sp. PSKA54]|uniref:AraC family transcriptional regulator n=1 Tax=Streptomyces himalayensis subsp. aureolus TaxID=2758039 RepID=A0A7W2HE84_9ACTN|nr:helix-turn-helix domain-containing protein [Streptomyces himalayensis]MBA4860565.1 AraC family transcriptional regulator [Streptomyces himalayensis subsp. aureolus]